MDTRKLVALCVLGAALLSGCDWSVARGDVARTGFNSSESGAGAITVTNVAGLTKTEAAIISVRNNVPQSSPVTGNGRLYLTGNDARLHVLDATSLHEVAGSPVALPGAGTNNLIWGQPTLGGNNVYVASNNRLYAFDATTLQARFNVATDGYYETGTYLSPIVTNGKVIVGGNNGGGHVDVFNATTGAKLDEFTSTGYLTAPVALSGNWIFYGDASGTVYGRDLTRASAGWSYDAPSAGGIDGIAVSGTTLVVSSRGGGAAMRALTTSGQNIGVFKNTDGTNFTSVSAPAIAAGKVYAIGTSGNLKAFTLSNRQQVGPNAVSHGTTVTVANGVVFTTGSAHNAFLRAFDATTLTQRLSSGGLIVSGSDAVVANGHVYVMSPAGVLESWKP